MCKWFILTEAFGIGPADRLSWQLQHGYKRCHVMLLGQLQPSKLCVLKVLVFWHWQAEVVILSGWQHYRKDSFRDRSFCHKSRSELLWEVLLQEDDSGNMSNSWRGEFRVYLEELLARICFKWLTDCHDVGDASTVATHLVRFQSETAPSVRLEFLVTKKMLN